ncbi:SGNH/GDSL hydrolase family protein [Gemmatimonadota bacterium]
MNMYNSRKRKGPASHLIIVILSFGLVAGCGLDSSTNNGPNDLDHPVRIMFIGNSLTGWGETTAHFENLADSAGIEVIIGSRAPNGASLGDHIESIETNEMIEQQQWHYIVLQGGGYLVAFPESLDVAAEPFEALQAIARNNWSETRFVLFMYWAMNPMPGDSYSFSEFSQMLHDGSLLLAERLGCMVAPVGWMWKRVVENRPWIDLTKDDIHPNETGGYLQACVYFATIFQKSPVGNTYLGQIDSDVARYLQQVAADVVLNHRSRWRLPGY